MELTWIITAILGLVIIYFLYILSKQNMDYWEKRGIFHMKPLPFFGSMLQMVLGRQGLHELTYEVYKKSTGRKYAGFMMFNKPVLVVRDLDLVNHVMIKDFNYFHDRNLPMDIDSSLTHAGVQFLTGDRWRVLRHRLTPTFTSSKMRNMFKQVKECSEEVVSYLKEKDDKDVNVRDMVIRFVLNVIGFVSFGIKVDALNEKIEKENAFYQNSKEFFTPSKLLNLKFVMFFSLPHVLRRFGVKLSNDKNEKFFAKLIYDLIQYRKQNAIKGNDFLQILIEQRQKEESLMQSGNNGYSTTLTKESLEDADELEDSELANHLKNVNFDTSSAIFTDQIIAGSAFFFLTGGTDTVATVVSFLLYELSIHKDIQTRLQNEIDTLLQENGFTYDVLKKMKYLDQVINEVMRMRPVAGTLIRVCTKDYTLPGTDLTIEKGQFVFIPLQGIQNDAQYFPEPEKFDPDRFEDMEAIPKTTFFPFGDGPRICIAMRMALMKTKILLISILSNFTVSLSEKTTLPLEMSHSSLLPDTTTGIWIKFAQRKNTFN